jgi:serine/threonine protein kinase
MKIARDIVKGMIYIHAANLIHLDLKPENLLLDVNGNVKVADFGLTVIRLDPRLLLKGGPKGTPLWMAPEMLLGKPFDEKADVYSFGIILWQLLTREEPFAEFTELEPFIKAVAVSGYRPPIPPGTNPRLAFLISKCWHALPALRPSFSEIDTQLLPHIIVESAIQDDVGRMMWKTHFLNLDFAPWEAFVIAFYSTLKLPLEVPTDEALIDEQLPPEPTDPMLHHASLNRLEDYARLSPASYARCVEEVKRRQQHSFFHLLKKLLVEKHHDQEVISMERFGGILLGLFGPLSLQQPLQLFERMAAVLPRPWFYGDLDKDAAFDLLSTKPAGTFLVRFSTNPEHTGFVISLVDHRKTVVHIRVKYQVGSPQPYSLASTGEHSNESYASLEELIIRNRNFMRDPCKNQSSPYTMFFVSSAFSSAGRGGYVLSFGTQS